MQYTHVLRSRHYAICNMQYTVQYSNVMLGKGHGQDGWIAAIWNCLSSYHANIHHITQTGKKKISEKLGMHAKMSCGHGRHDQDGWITAIWNILLGSARGWLTTTSTSTSTLRCTVSWNRRPPPLLLRLAQHGPLVSSR